MRRGPCGVWLGAALLAAVGAVATATGSGAARPPVASLDARPSVPPAPRTEADVVPRTVLALYDGAWSESPRFTTIHGWAEMPLNHLGLVVRYHDIRAGLPPVADLAGVRGVLTWFAADAMPDPLGYLRWIDALVSSGRPLVVIGQLGVARDDDGQPTPLAEINRVLARLGWRDDGGWITTTYGSRYRVEDDRLVGFERALPTAAPPYGRVRATAPDARVALSIAIDDRRDTASDLIIISPRGARVAPEYGAFVNRAGTDEFRQWVINPFEFFRDAFATDEVPKADTTTLSGRRIYYSHLDGDGWRNLTQVEPYRSRYTMSARVVLEQVVRPFPDLPVTIGAIVGDLDPAWQGNTESLRIAREMYAEPHVEPSIHTYSHPLEWGAFEPDTDHDLERAEDGAWRPRSDLTHESVDSDARSYDVRPFSLTTEIDEAAAFIDGLLPPGKRVGLVQWSGDTLPFEQAVAHVRSLGLANINGGDTRFDREFPSAAWVAPLGVQVGDELQVYASNSNENTYTDLWHDRFFGFSFLTATVRNTGSPRRLKPFNVYYHMYSGERLSSLNAVLANLTHARSLPLAPVETSRFSRIAAGFSSVRFERLGQRAWRVHDRGALQTIRFDRASLEGVDFARSEGVIGQRHELGGLFVALDETTERPVVALKPIRSASREPREDRAYLVESRWRVWNVQASRDGVSFVTTGYGPGEFTWQWPFPGHARVAWRVSGRTGEVVVDASGEGRLVFALPQQTGTRVEVTISRSEAIDAG